MMKIEIELLLTSGLLSKIIENRICKTIIFPVVLYGCETSSLKLRVEHKPMRDEVTGGWRKLINDEVKKDKMGEACSTNG
jgi:hypothetical protein